jgi:hypothetical protein
MSALPLSGNNSGSQYPRFSAAFVVGADGLEPPTLSV